MRITLAVFLLWFIPTFATAQSIAISGGYDWAHPDFENVHLFSGHLNGWRAEVVAPLNGGLGVVADVNGVYGTGFKTGVVVRPFGTARPWFYTFEGGLRYTLNTGGPVRPFVEGLLGATHGQVGTMGVDFLGTTTDTRFEGGIDGGVTIRFSSALGAEGDVGFRRSQLFDQRLNFVHVGGRIVWWVTNK